MIEGKNIICFAPANWDWKTQGSCKRFMRILGEKNRVLYINNLSFTMPNVKKIGKTALFARIRRKLFSYLRMYYRVNKGISVFNPVFLPFIYNRFPGLSLTLLRLQIAGIQKILGMRDPIVWIENPFGVRIISALKPHRVLYYRTDKFEAHRDVQLKQTLESLEHELTNQADYIFCVSRKLYEDKIAERENGVHYLPHGVDLEHFQTAMSDLPIPHDISTIKKPIAGYFGSLSDSNDEDLLYQLATSRPEYSFVLIGQKLGRFSKISDLENVHFLGPRDYDDLPAYGKAFDACLLVWKMSEWIQYCNPLKTMEYLAMGKPVVSVPIPEVKSKFDGIISIANDQDEFLAMLDDELKNDSPEKQNMRIETVKSETWRARVEEISRVIDGSGTTSEITVNASMQ